MHAMIDRQKKLIDFKIDEIQVKQKGGKTVPKSEFSKLQTLMDRYAQMNKDLAEWTNGSFETDAKK